MSRNSLLDCIVVALFFAPFLGDQIVHAYAGKFVDADKHCLSTVSGHLKVLQIVLDYQHTHVIFEPLDFIAKLAALVPRPKVNLTRYHGVFARGGLPPNSKHRALSSKKYSPFGTARCPAHKQRQCRRCEHRWRQALFT